MAHLSSVVEPSASPSRTARDRLYDHSMLMFSDIPWAETTLASYRRCQASPDPVTADLYRNRADRLERALTATKADLRDLERDLAHASA